MNRVIFPFYARLALVLLSIVLIIHLMVLGQSVLVPLFFAFMIAFLLFPVANWLERNLNMRCWLASLLAVLLAIAIIGGLLYFITYQVLLFSQDIPLLQQRVNEWFIQLQNYIATEYKIDSSEQVAYMNQAINNILNIVANSIGTIFIGITGFIFWTVIAFIYCYFILTHRRLLVHFVLRLFSDKHEGSVRYILVETKDVANNYIIGLLIEFAVIAIVNSAAFLLLGIKYAVLLGLIAALLNFIPYLGIMISSVLVFLVTMANSSPLMAFYATAILFILHVLDANILLPRVVGDKVKMNPLITIVAVLIGGAIWGVSGMFLSIPLSAMLKIVFSNVKTLEPWAILMGEDKLLKKHEEEKRNQKRQ